MGVWNYQFDQNDHVQDVIASLETEEIEDKNSKLCNPESEYRAKFNSFEKLINLDTLRKNEILTILGVLLNYARRDTADVFGGSPFEVNFPDKLPKGYPEVYKELAIEKIEEYDEFIKRFNPTEFMTKTTPEVSGIKLESGKDIEEKINPDYKQKYLKYKQKYLELKKLLIK